MLRNYLYKFHFHGAVHIGEDDGRNVLQSSNTVLHSDTLFSALCVEAANNETELNQLISYAKTGKVLLSDCFPYKNEELFLPKPLISATEGLPQIQAPNLRKSFKKIKYLPSSLWKNYISFLFNGGIFPIDVCLNAFKDVLFLDERTCAAVRGAGDTVPYVIRSIQFNKNCGLYCIFAFENDKVRDQFEVLLRSLSFSGIGGKRSAGFGKFELEYCGALEDSLNTTVLALNSYLTCKSASHWVTLNTALPKDEEINELLKTAEVSLCRRGGFVDKMGRKKKTVYAFVSGSSFSEKFLGQVRDVSSHGSHPVYRMLEPMFLGVDV